MELEAQRKLNVIFNPWWMEGNGVSHVALHTIDLKLFLPLKRLLISWLWIFDTQMYWKLQIVIISDYHQDICIPSTGYLLDLFNHSAVEYVINSIFNFNQVRQYIVLEVNSVISKYHQQQTFSSFIFTCNLLYYLWMYNGVFEV